MPSKCIATKEIKDRKTGDVVVGFEIGTGKSAGLYENGVVYPNDLLARKWKYDFEHVEAEKAPSAKTKKPKDSKTGATDNGPEPTDSAPKGGNE